MQYEDFSEVGHGLGRFTKMLAGFFEFRRCCLVTASFMT